MAEKVELILTVDNAPYVSGVKEAQKATQQLHNTVENNAKGQKGLIAQEIELLGNLRTLRMRANDPKMLAEYNRRIQESTNKLREYETVGVNANKNIEKSGNSLMGSVGKWALGFASLGAAVSILKKAFQETEAGLRTFNAVGAVTKQVLYDIVSGNKLNIASIAQSIKANKEAEGVRVKQRQDLIDIAKAQTVYNQLYFTASDQTKTETERLQALNQAMLAHEVIIETKIENAKEELSVLEQSIAARPNETKLLDAYAAKLAEIETIKGQQFSETRRLESQRTGIIEDEMNRQIEAEKKAYDERLKAQEKFNNLSIKLIDEYDRSNIESLEGVDKLRAQRAFALKQLDEFRDQLEALGKLSAEQEAMFRKLGENVQKTFMEGLTSEVPTAETKNAFSNFVDSIIKDPSIQKDIIPQKEDLTSIWQLLGIDPDSEKGQEQIDAIKDAADTVKDILDDTFEKRVDIAQRERELLDTQIAETQRALELESELMEEGFANNVTAKQKELDQLKQQREKALAEEEKAIKQQQSFDRLSQTGSIITSVANILKSFTKLGPLGLGLAAVAIGSLYAIFSSAKAKASKVTKLAKGGSGTTIGMFKGRSHAEGGESFLSQVEVERGEAFGVLSRKATGKYGKVFHEMVSSFNKDQMPSFGSPIIRMENTGSNSRLDKVIKEQQKMNTNLKQAQIFTIGNKRVIKNGKNIRIIG